VPAAAAAAAAAVRYEEEVDGRVTLGIFESLTRQGLPVRKENRLTVQFSKIHKQPL
jgi:hypothetical protein